MKVIIFSDSHRSLFFLEKVLKKEEPVDMLFHLGDIEGQDEQLTTLAGCPCEFVSGNCDFYTKLPRTKVVELCGHTIFMTHGHTYSVNFREDTLLLAARENGADIAMYGHTHVPSINQYDGITVVNPGSITLPRQLNQIPSYMVMEIEEGKAPSFEIRYFQRG